MKLIYLILFSLYSIFIIYIGYTIVFVTIAVIFFFVGKKKYFINSLIISFAIGISLSIYTTYDISKAVSTSTSSTASIAYIAVPKIFILISTLSLVISWGFWVFFYIVKGKEKLSSIQSVISILIILSTIFYSSFIIYLESFVSKASSSNITTENLERLYENTYFENDAILLSNISRSEKVSGLLLHKIVLMDKDNISDFSFGLRSMFHKYSSINKNIIKNKNVLPKTLSIFSKSKNIYVREHVLSHPKTPKEIKEILKEKAKQSNKYDDFFIIVTKMKELSLQTDEIRELYNVYKRNRHDKLGWQWNLFPRYFAINNKTPSDVLDDIIDNIKYIDDISTLGGVAFNASTSCKTLLKIIQIDTSNTKMEKRHKPSLDSYRRTAEKNYDDRCKGQ